MSTNNTIIVYPCVLRLPVVSSCVLVFIALPFNLLIFKILISNYRLRLPRHKILLSLTVSDCMQITLVAFTLFVALLSKLNTTDAFCQVLRNFAGFVGTLTLIASSGSIIALSIERYITCVHCLRVYQILSHKRVKIALCGIWLFAVVGALADEKRYKSNSTENIPMSRFANVLYGSVIMFSTTCLVYTQINLYLVARRLIRNQPGCSFGSQAEAHDFRKRQLKASIAASAVVVLYVVCMCPLGIYMFTTAFTGVSVQSSFRIVSIFLAQVNTFVDPFVYGLGMEDTRRTIKRELKKMKSFIKDI